MDVLSPFISVILIDHRHDHHGDREGPVPPTFEAFVSRIFVEIVDYAVTTVTFPYFLQLCSDRLPPCLTGTEFRRTLKTILRLVAS